MPLIKYSEPPINADAQSVIDNAVAILRDFNARGFKLSLRQLYYQFVTRNLIPNSEKSYKKLSDIIDKGRRAGQIDWDHIEDRGRSIKKRNHWDSPSDIVQAVSKQYTIDLWADQKVRLEVWVEKDALVQVVERAARPWDVTYFANKGYCSVSAMWDAGYNRFRTWLNEGTDVVIIHLGDHDPSGINMTDDIGNRLREYSRPVVKDKVTKRRGQLQVERIALNMDQIEQYEPPPNPAKVTDPRARNKAGTGYIDIYGDESWELDALDPEVIVPLIEDKIKEYVDLKKFQARQRLERQQRNELVAIANNYDEIVEQYPGEEPNEDEDETDGNSKDEEGGDEG